MTTASHYLDRTELSYSPVPLSQTQQRITSLLAQHLCIDHLNDRLQDLPQQFQRPQPRPWKRVDWSAIAPDQIIGMPPSVFAAILKGAIDTEAPIRGYTQTSRQYLEHLHPPMARFVGGTIAADGHLLETGLWEKEERRHTPALIKLYTQLTQEKIVPQPHQVRLYQASDDPALALYRHGLHRVATEYGAACLYLWLMAYTTGPLQAVLEELVVDEINHMTKFWGFGLWAYSQSSLPGLFWTLVKATKGRVRYTRDRSSLMGTLQRMTTVLGWQAWSATHRLTFAYTCIHALGMLRRWNQSLTPAFLQELFGPSPRY